MTLVNPLALYLFSLAGLVVLAYFLRRRGQLYRVSAFFLWQRAEERGARALRFARRSFWLLLLQLLALSLLVLALTDPAYYMAGARGRLAILIDGSASMFTAQGGRTRYELAVERALALIDSTADELTVIQAKRYPKMLVPLTADRDEAGALLRSSQPTFEGGASPKELFELLKGQAPLSQFQRVVYITDHPLSEEVEGLPLETILVGGAARNLGLTSFVVRQEPDPAWGYSIFIRAKNYTDREERPILTITADGEGIFSQRVTLPARSGRSLALSHPTPLPTEFTATLGPEDDFPWDNRRYLAIQRPKRKVLWLGREDRFLRGALAAAGDFLIGQKMEGEYELTVAYGTEIQAEIKGNILLVNSSYPPLLRLRGPEEVRSPISIEAGGHPLLAGVETSDILIAKANRAVLPPGGDVLLSADGLPLIYLKQEKDRKICYIGFDLWWSNLVLTVDFPILMKRMLAWLLPPRTGSSLEVGEPLPLEGAVTVTGPRGRTYYPQPGKPPIAELPGFYRIDDGQTVRYLAVNLPPEESEVGSERGIKQGESLHEGGPPGSWPRPLWGYLALGGLLALVLELWCYDRAPFWRRRER